MASAGRTFTTPVQHQLQLLPVLFKITVFYNLFTLLSLPAEVLRTRKLVMQLLLDEQLECVHLVEPLRRSTVDAADPDGPKRPSQRPAAYRVKKTMSEFRRTHHDNWQEHRQCFTDDQLLVLTNLLVSPCYYA
ncbi:hypothetical protein GOODEAATRI_003076 [Goodea atripinnis]|uniref:Proteasome activator complex subunit 4 C-terminal domain-containing protein n=1 Tax=Goodea atripinnis TaxID=208336 RepID=A0ABV0P147_9TELE